MGCGMSTEDKEGKQRNEEIENQLKKDRMMQKNEIKMLLLGTNSPRFNKLLVSFQLTSFQVLVNPASPPFSSR